MSRPWSRWVGTGHTVSQLAFTECLLYTSPKVRREKQTDGCLHPSVHLSWVGSLPFLYIPE